jgi:hypothetical protein
LGREELKAARTREESVSSCPAWMPVANGICKGGCGNRQQYITPRGRYETRSAALDAFGYCSGCWVHVHRKCTAAGTCRLVEEESKKRGSDA